MNVTKNDTEFGQVIIYNPQQMNHCYSQISWAVKGWEMAVILFSYENLLGQHSEYGFHFILPGSLIVSFNNLDITNIRLNASNT